MLQKLKQFESTSDRRSATMSWQFDYAHSEIQFKVRHMMVSWVRGQFENFTGAIHLDEDNPERSSVEVQIEAASINTRQADRDAHLRSPDFLDAVEYPTLIFRSKQVQRTGEETAKVVGDLTIRGVTREVVLDVEYAGQQKSPFGPYYSAGFSATTKINRKEWGLTWNAAIETGGVVVGDEIHISIEVELNKTAAAQLAEAVAAD
jgi:polyisoprenoid-binding protein YceI